MTSYPPPNLGRINGIPASELLEGLGHLHQLVLVTDTRGSVQWASQALIRSLGSHADVIGHHTADLCAHYLAHHDALGHEVSRHDALGHDALGHDALGHDASSHNDSTTLPRGSMADESPIVESSEPLYPQSPQNHHGNVRGESCQSVPG